jgi:hypothetical protein
LYKKEVKAAAQDLPSRRLQQGFDLIGCLESRASQCCLPFDLHRMSTVLQPPYA